MLTNIVEVNPKPFSGTNQTSLPTKKFVILFYGKDSSNISG